METLTAKATFALFPLSEISEKWNYTLGGRLARFLPAETILHIRAEWLKGDILSGEIQPRTKKQWDRLMDLRYNSEQNSIKIYHLADIMSCEGAVVNVHDLMDYRKVPKPIQLPDGGTGISFVPVE